MRTPKFSLEPMEDQIWVEILSLISNMLQGRAEGAGF